MSVRFRTTGWAGKIVRSCCLCLMLFAAASCDDPNRGPPTRYSYFDAVVEFTAEGQRLKAETTVQCMTPGGLTPGHRPLAPTQSHSFVTKRLPSGAGVMFVIPRGCSAAPGHKLPPRDAIPMAYWLDDAADPSIVEMYRSETTIGPGNHIEGIHDAHVTEKYGYGEIPQSYSDPTLEIPWLETRKLENRHKNKESWIGYSVTYAPKQLWSRHESLTEKFKDQHEIVRLRAAEIPEDVRRLFNEYTLYNDGVLQTQQSSNDTPDSPYQVGQRTHPAFLKPEGQWTPDSAYHVSLKPGWPSGKTVFTPVTFDPNDQNRQIIVDGIVVKGPFRTMYFYDSRTEKLFRVHHHRL